MKIFSAAAPPFYKNGFVVACESTAEAILIDPGDEVQDLLKVVASSGVSVRAILLTHAHLDHITGVRAATEAYPAPIWLHREDLFLYDAIEEQGRLFGLDVKSQPPVDRFYEAGVPFPFGRLVVDVLHTPGHCPGGVCLAIGDLDQATRELFVGDTLFAGSIGRTDLPGGSSKVLLQSIRDVLLRFPDDAVVHPGHGPDTTIGIERRTNPFLVAR
jgi:glyoxylase-like metal-dependent hydrolase (beta-lactamase superfamily II)